METLFDSNVKIQAKTGTLLLNSGDINFLGFSIFGIQPIPIVIKLALGVLLQFSPVPLPDGFTSYMQEELPNSLVEAVFISNDECGGQGAAIDLRFQDALTGGSPYVHCP